MELTDRLSTLHPSAQLKVMERVFLKISLAFGNQMLAKWQGIDLQEVYADWAQSLRDFTLAQINHGIDVSKEQEHPPSLGEFMNLCRQYRPPQMLKLGYKISDEQMEKNKAEIHKLVESLRKRKTA